MPLSTPVAFVTVPKHKIIRCEECTSVHFSGFQRTPLQSCTANCSDIIKDVYKSWRWYHITYNRCFTAEVTETDLTGARQHQNWKWYNHIRQKEFAAKMAKVLPLWYRLAVVPQYCFSEDIQNDSLVKLA